MQANVSKCKRMYAKRKMLATASKCKRMQANATKFKQNLSRSKLTETHPIKLNGIQTHASKCKCNQM